MPVGYFVLFPISLYIIKTSRSWGMKLSLFSISYLCLRKNLFKLNKDTGLKRASLVAQLVKNPPAMQETFFNSWVGKSPRRNGRLSPPAFLGFPGGSDGKRIRLQCGRPGLDPWVGKIPWRRAWQLTPVFLPGESPWMEEPGRLQSMGSQRVGQD